MYDVFYLFTRWLFECARTGRRLSEESFFVDRPSSASSSSFLDTSGLQPNRTSEPPQPRGSEPRSRASEAKSNYASRPQPETTGKQSLSHSSTVSHSSIVSHSSTDSNLPPNIAAVPSMSDDGSNAVKTNTVVGEDKMQRVTSSRTASSAAAAAAKTPVKGRGGMSRASSSSASLGDGATVREPAGESLNDDQDSVFEKPASKEPASKEPAFKEPAFKGPAFKEPAFKEPASKEPAFKEPARPPAAVLTARSLDSPAKVSSKSIPAVAIPPETDPAPAGEEADISEKPAKKRRLRSNARNPSDESSAKRKVSECSGNQMPKNIATIAAVVSAGDVVDANIGALPNTRMSRSSTRQSASVGTSKASESSKENLTNEAHLGAETPSGRDGVVSVGKVVGNVRKDATAPGKALAAGGAPSFEGILTEEIEARHTASDDKEKSAGARSSAPPAESTETIARAMSDGGVKTAVGRDDMKSPKKATPADAKRNEQRVLSATNSRVEVCCVTYIY